MALVIQNGSLLRSGGALASGSECCCNASQSPYAVCGSECAFRARVKDIDSEMAECGGDLPEGWLLDALYECEDISSVETRLAPWIGAIKGGLGGDCEPYEDIVDAPGNPQVCSDYERAGMVGSPYGPGLITGGERSFARSGFTSADFSDTSYKSFLMNYSIAIFCDDEDEEDVEECLVCNGAQTEPRKAYYLHAVLYIEASGTRYQNSQVTGFSSRTFAGTLQRQRILTQSCEEMNDFTRLSQYDCTERPENVCEAVPDLFPPDPLEITVSMENGVTVGGETFPWDTSELIVFPDDDDFDFDFTDDMKDPGGITLYRADACCCDIDCNPLP